MSSSTFDNSDKIEIARLKHLKKQKKPMYVRAIRKASSMGLHAKKMVYQTVRGSRDETRRILFIVGCQRSGTTMMTELFEQDPDAIVFSEHSRLSSGDARDRLRLNPLSSVKKTLDRSLFPLMVLKPLVETQNVRMLLDYFPNSYALWMYRHYRDVAKSDLNRFGIHNGVRNLRYIAEQNENDWRAERVSNEVQETVMRFYDDRLDPYEAAALFWYARNRLYFELSLGEDHRVKLCQYEALVKHPAHEMGGIYRFIGRRYPGEDTPTATVHTKSVGSGEKVTLRPEIEELCTTMWGQLNEAQSLQPPECNQTERESCSA